MWPLLICWSCRASTSGATIISYQPSWTSWSCLWRSSHVKLSNWRMICETRSKRRETKVSRWDMVIALPSSWWRISSFAKKCRRRWESSLSATRSSTAFTTGLVSTGSSNNSTARWLSSGLNPRQSKCYRKEDKTVDAYPSENISKVSKVCKFWNENKYKTRLR